MDMTVATDIVSKVNDWVEVAGLIVLAVVFVSTILAKAAGVLARFTKDTSDDIKVAKAQAVVHDFALGVLEAVTFFPTLGKNPRTKMLEKQLKQVDPTLIVQNNTVINVKAESDEPSKAD